MELINVLFIRIAVNVVWIIVPIKYMHASYVFDMAARSNVKLTIVKHMLEVVVIAYNMVAL